MGGISLRQPPLSANPRNLWFICQRNIPEWILVLEIYFFESFGCLACFNGGAHRILSRGCRGKGQEPMSSQVRQPCLALELPNQELASDPLACRPALNLPPKAAFGVRERWLDFGCEFLWGIFIWKCTVCGLAPSGKSPLKILTQNLHTQLNIRAKNPRQNLHPKSAPKIRTQNPRPSSQPIFTEPHNERPQGVSLELHIVATYAGLSENKNNRTKSPLRDSGGAWRQDSWSFATPQKCCDMLLTKRPVFWTRKWREPVINLSSWPPRLLPTTICAESEPGVDPTRSTYQHLCI